MIGMAIQRGDRLVYAAEPRMVDGYIQSPYLDNRAGIWAALNALANCESVAVAFTTGEESGGGGAAICARFLWEKFNVNKALISDITWDTEDVHCGSGVALSMRDSKVPSQRFVSEVVALAEKSGIPYQLEVESEGGSDGAIVERSGFPIDWMFIGAPEERPHSSTERIAIADLEAMAKMLIYLADSFAAKE